ncbi:MAG: exodeoxyribonuclease VII large subunit [Leptolyngbyaceae cyanobacterium T60_A2020_046]|nr:exodeoxyribonuclease VII large subunit [Leptolyngbyaceae cyanobacterium T60_A2020_046]
MRVIKAIQSPETALSVGGVSAYIQALIEQDRTLMQLWVTGEVASCQERNGHLFWTLQDLDTPAALNCVVWRSQRHRLAAEPRLGEQIIVLGQVKVYAQRSTYQLSVVQVLPAGAGLKALRYQQLRARLAAEGLFDAALKRSLPSYPSTVAVVTSPHAAAWGDIQRTLSQRHPGLRVLLAPAVVQGAQAADTIATALDRVAQDGQAEVVIVARGGGAREDLDCFDDERVVRAIALCPIPVITGIGHQRDETLADLAADWCAHTPTAAAECTVPALADCWLDHHQRIVALQATLQGAVQCQQVRVATMRRRLERLRFHWRVQQTQQYLTWQRQRLMQTVLHRLHTAQQHCAHLGQTVQNLDPQAILQRGYALVRSPDGDVVGTVSDLNVGDRLSIQLASGTLTVTVSNIHPTPEVMDWPRLPGDRDPPSPD